MGREETSLASALGSRFLLTLRIVTIQIAGLVGFPFMEIFCVPAGSVADVQLFLLIFFFFKQFLFVDSTKQTFGLAVNRGCTRPAAGSW